MAYIYKITNQINGKIYIGKTLKTIQERWKEHQNDSRRSHLKKRPLYEAMQKYGVENFVIEEVEECDYLIINEREQYWIKKYRSYIGFEDAWGYNATLGGDGKVYCDYDWIYSLWQEGQIIKEIAATTSYCVDTISKVLKEKGVTSKEIFSRSEKRRCKRPVCMLDKNTQEVIKTFACANEAARYLGKERGWHISEVCRKERKSAYGYLWKYL